MHTPHSHAGKGGAAKFNELLKIQIKVHHQILNEWGACPILNLKKNFELAVTTNSGKKPDIDVREKTHQIMLHSLGILMCMHM